MNEIRFAPFLNICSCEQCSFRGFANIQRDNLSAFCQSLGFERNALNVKAQYWGLRHEGFLSNKHPHSLGVWGRVERLIGGMEISVHDFAVVYLAWLLNSGRSIPVRATHLFSGIVEDVFMSSPENGYSRVEVTINRYRVDVAVFNWKALPIIGLEVCDSHPTAYLKKIDIGIPLLEFDIDNIFDPWSKYLYASVSGFSNSRCTDSE